MPQWTLKGLPIPLVAADTRTAGTGRRSLGFDGTPVASAAGPELSGRCNPGTDHHPGRLAGRTTPSPPQAAQSLRQGTLPQRHAVARRVWTRLAKQDMRYGALGQFALMAGSLAIR